MTHEDDLTVDDDYAQELDRMRRFILDLVFGPVVGPLEEDGDLVIEVSIDALTESFHNHLDVCSQCERNPFGLCEIGMKILRQIPFTKPGDTDGTPENDA